MKKVKKWNSLNRSKTAFYINVFQNPSVAEVPINRQQLIFFHRRRKPNIKFDLPATTGKEWPRCFIIRVCLWTWRAKVVDKIPVPQGGAQIDNCWSSRDKWKISCKYKRWRVCIMEHLRSKNPPATWKICSYIIKWSTVLEIKRQCSCKHWSLKINSWKGSPTQSLGKKQQRRRT